MSKERSRNDMGLFRFYFVAGSSPLFVSHIILHTKYVMKHVGKYTMEQRDKFVRRIYAHMKRRGRVKTDYFGLENIPEEGGFILYSNHQGKYDAIGILHGVKRQCGILMEKKQGTRVVAKQTIQLCDGVLLDLDNPRKQLEQLSELAQKVKSGRGFLIFPEGKWGNNKNNLQKFNAGCFRCSYESQSVVIPVAIIDSYKGLNGNSLKKVTTQVHFLKPIMYDEYKDMKRNELCDLVKQRIQDKIEEVLKKREKD